MLLNRSFLILLLMCSGLAANAVDSDLQEVDIINLELDNNVKVAPTQKNKESQKLEAPQVTDDSSPSAASTTSTNTETQDLSKPSTTPAVTDEDVSVKKEENTLKDFSGLGKLAPFSEVSVLQKRFLPKTGRFQINLAATIITNDPFFTTMGAAGRFGYFFNESWGVEADLYMLSTDQRQTTKELKDIEGVTTENLIYPKAYTGLNLVWVPVYGKMAWFNKNIIPFDLYFSGGAGSTTTQTNQSVSTFHVGTGQIFAVSKQMAYRWDFSWNFFNATGTDGVSSSFNNLFLSAGVSFFFPEAKYR